METTHTRLYRPMDDAMISGVCAGIARRYGYDVTLIRLIAALLAMTGGLGVLAYALLWSALPLEEASPVTAPPTKTEDLDDAILAARCATDAARFAADATVAAEAAARAAHRALQHRNAAAGSTSAAAATSVAATTGSPS